MSKKAVSKEWSKKKLKVTSENRWNKNGGKDEGVKKIVKPL